MVLRDDCRTFEVYNFTIFFIFIFIFWHVNSLDGFCFPCPCFVEMTVTKAVFLKLACLKGSQEREKRIIHPMNADIKGEVETKKGHFNKPE